METIATSSEPGVGIEHLNADCIFPTSDDGIATASNIENTGVQDQHSDYDSCRVIGLSIDAPHPRAHESCYQSSPTIILSNPYLSRGTIQGHWIF